MSNEKSIIERYPIIKPASFMIACFVGAVISGTITKMVGGITLVGIALGILTPIGAFYVSRNIGKWLTKSK